YLTTLYLVWLGCTRRRPSPRLQANGSRQVASELNRPTSTVFIQPASKDRLRTHALGERLLARVGGPLVGDIDPAAAQRLVHVDELRVALAAGVHGGKLRAEQFILRIQH